MSGEAVALRGPGKIDGLSSTHDVTSTPRRYTVSFEVVFSKEVDAHVLQRAVAGMKLWPPYEANKKDWVWERVPRMELRAPYWGRDNVHPITREAVFYTVHTECKVGHQEMLGAENLQVLLLRKFLQEFPELRIRSTLHLTSVPICADPKSQTITSVMLA